MNTNLNFYQVTNEYQETYYQFPKWLFDDAYKDLSIYAKTAYMLLKNQNQLAIKNHWFDADGRIFFTFTNKHLMEKLNVCESTVSKIKKELVKYKLLFVKKMGFDRNSGRNLPSRLYLLKPTLDVEYVYRATKTKEKLKTDRKDAEGNVTNCKVGNQKTTKPKKKKIKNYVTDSYILAIINQFDTANKPMIYISKQAKKQAKKLSELATKVEHSKIDKIVQKIIDNEIISDAPAYLIKALEQSIKATANTKKQNHREKSKPTYGYKRVEKGTDWSKKKAKTYSDEELDVKTRNLLNISEAEKFPDSLAKLTPGERFMTVLKNCFSPLTNKGEGNVSTI